MAVAPLKYQRPRRPAMRYHGGKYRIAPKIVAHFPPHRVYVEPFCGAASVLLAKEPSIGEVINDLDGEIVNVFRVMRDPAQALRLRDLVQLTPFSRTEFELAYEPAEDPVEQARRTIARSFMAHGTTSRRRASTGFRGKAFRQNQPASVDWAKYPDHILDFCRRLLGVTIEHADALYVISRHADDPDTLFYCDPPYPISTRTSMVRRGANEQRAYAVDLTDAEHVQLAEMLRGISGMAIVSGYACDLYDRELYADWHRVEIAALADGSKPRTEVLWMNPAAAAASGRAATQSEPVPRAKRASAFPSPSVPTEITG